MLPHIGHSLTQNGHYSCKTAIFSRKSAIVGSLNFSYECRIVAGRKELFALDL